MKEDQKATLKKMERLAAEIERNPLTVKLRTNEAAETLSKRQAAAAKIADLQIDMEATGILQREIDGMVEKLAVMERERRELFDEIGQRRYAFAKERSGIESDIRQAEKVLLTTYDPRIDEEISYFRERFEELRKRTVNSQKQAENNVETKTITTFSNAGSIRRALAYCTEVVRQLEAMRLEPVFDPAKVDRLQAEAPDADLSEEFSATKKRYNDDCPGLSAALRQASDDISDLTIKSLLERGKKLLRK